MIPIYSTTVLWYETAQLMYGYIISSQKHEYHKNMLQRLCCWVHNWRHQSFGTSSHKMYMSGSKKLTLKICDHAIDLKETKNLHSHPIDLIGTLIKRMHLVTMNLRWQIHCDHFDQPCLLRLCISSFGVKIALGVSWLPISSIVLH